MLASNAISMETKQRVMKRAVSTCPTINLNIQGKEVPSLMDSGSTLKLLKMKCNPTNKKLWPNTPITLLDYGSLPQAVT